MTWVTFVSGPEEVLAPLGVSPSNHESAFNLLIGCLWINRWSECMVHVRLSLWKAT